MTKTIDFNIDDFQTDLEYTIKAGKKCLIVEGGFDKKFYSIVVNIDNKVKFFLLESSDVKRDIVEIATKNTFLKENDKALFVIDKDYGLEIEQSNIGITDFCDVENYLFRGSSFNTFIKINFAHNHLDSLFNVSCDEELYLITEKLIQMLKCLTILRYTSYIKSLCIPFGSTFPKYGVSERKKRFKHVKKTLNDNHEVDLNTLLDVIRERTHYNTYNNDKILNEYAAYRNITLDDKTNGHDLISLLTILLNETQCRNFNDVEVEEKLLHTVNRQTFFEFNALKKIYEFANP